jgi:TonB family protein
MRNELVLALLGCLALAGMPASAAERWLATQLVEVSIAPDGRVTDASLPRTELGPDVQAEILRRVRQFEFEPAAVNGVPATTETTLAVKLAVEEVDDRLAVTVDGATITIGMAQLKGPRFPRSQMSRIGEAR